MNETSRESIEDTTEGGFQGAFRQSMAWLHAWAGIVFSLVLYFVFITGTFGYFNTEIDYWMQPEAPSYVTTQTYAEQAEVGFAYLREHAPDGTRYFVDFPSERSNGAIRVFANLKEANADGDRFLNEYIDPNTGRVLQVRETGGGDALYRMHYALHYMPYEVAIYIVGLATLFMFLAIVTGIVTHKKIFKDFFTLRFGKGQRSWLDSHNMSSVLALPFMIMITYSGLVFYTFEYSPGVFVLNMGVSQESQDELYNYMYPGFERAQPTGESAQMVDISGPIETALREWPGARLRYVDLRNPGDTAAEYLIGRTPEGIARGGSILKFDAQTAVLLPKAQPQPADTVFSQAVLSLHEGRFADYYLRWLYFLSGLLGAAMIATGSLLWAKKRRTQLKGALPSRSLVFVERANLATIVGLPLGCAAYFWANRLLPVEMPNRAEWELHCLFLVWALSFIHAGARELRRGWREQVALLAGLFMALPLLNALTTETHLGMTLIQGDWTRAGFDLSAFVFGAICCAVWSRLDAPAEGSSLVGIENVPSQKLGVDT